MTGVSARMVRTFALALLTSVGLWSALVSYAFAESISNYDVDIQVADDGTLLISESIDYDFQGTQRHGIYRHIDDTYDGDASVWYKDRYADFKVLSVTRNGAAEVYKTESQEGLALKIGNPESTITGIQQYKIVYEVSGAMLQVDDKHELYWNVTGNEWEVSIESVKVTVRSSEGQLQSTYACYVGKVGENRTCTSVSSDGLTTTFLQESLALGEGLTVAHLVQLNTPPQILERYNIIFIYGALLLLWCLGLTAYVLKWKFTYRKTQAIVAQYEPLPDFKPMFTGVLIDNRLDPRDITAGIVYLAQQGFISIKKTTKKVMFMFEADDYEVTLNKLLLDSEEFATSKELLRLLFDDISISTIGSTVLLSKLKIDLSMMEQNRASFLKLQNATKEDLRSRGYFEQNQRLSKIMGILTLSLLVMIFLLVISVSKPVMQFALLIEALVVTLFLSLLLTSGRRTEKGYEALNYLKGFKEFLSVTEKERYAFHNAPTLSPDVFMQYLPYAIAFGVEEQWSEVFKDIVIQNPGWYSGSDGVASFNAAALTANLNMFSNSFAGTTSARSSSGSFGGGFSGGGFGGGGGGSW